MVVLQSKCETRLTKDLADNYATQSMMYVL